jgi:hypothetical protein
MTADNASTADTPRSPAPSPTPLLVIAWLWVALPLAYGVYELINTALQLFGK